MTHRTFTPLLALSALAAVGQTQAQTIKADNATDLGNAASWVGGVLPAATATAQINSTLQGFSALPVATNLTIRSLSFVDPASAVTLTVSNTRTFTLGDGAAPNGTAWIDMSSATKDLTIARTGTGVLRLTSPNSATNVFNMNVASDRTLTLDTAIVTTNTRKNLGVNGSGTVRINGALDATAGFLGLVLSSGTLELNGANKWRASANSTTLAFTERFEMSGGTLVLGNDSALVNEGGPAGSNAPNPFKFNGGTVQAGGGDRTITTTGASAIQHGYRIGGNFTVSGTNSLTLTGGPVTNVTNATNTLTNSISGTGKSFTIASTLALSNDATDRVLEIDGTGTTAISGQIVNGGTSTAGGLKKSGSGTLTLSNTGNSFGGALTIAGGSVLLGASNVIPDAASVVLSGGKLDLAGFSETVGTLGLTSSSLIDLGGGTIAFADSSAQSWTGTLSFVGTYTTTSVRFGTSSSALTPGQISSITFNGLGGYGLDGSGFLVAVPEPATCAAALGLLGVAAAALRRRKT